MIKNVVVVNDYDYVQGGASLVALESANLLYEKGYNVIFFCGVSNKEKTILKKEIKCIVINEYDSLSNPNRIKGMIQGINNKKAFKEMCCVLSQYNNTETVVFIHGYTKALSTSFIKACKKYNVKTILTAHDYFSICSNGGLFNYKNNCICTLQGTKKCKWCNCDSRNYLFKWYRNYRFYRQEKNKFRDSIDYLITISDTNEKLLKPFFKNAKFIRIYNPTSIEKQEPRVKCENNKYYIYIGRIDKEKGINLMCEAFVGAKKELIIVGAGTVLDELKEKYESNYIHFTGWVDHEEALHFMRGAKALVFPSLLPEGAPLTVFEAQSMGLPIIISKYSNGKDFVNDENGWVYNPYEKEELMKILVQANNYYNKSKESYDKYWSYPYTKYRYISEINELLNNI